MHFLFSLTWMIYLSDAESENDRSYFLWNNFDLK